MSIRILGYVRLLWRLNIAKTLIFNFKVFDARTAMKLPVYIFGPVVLSNVSGNVRIKGTIKRGMIQFGSDDENVIASNEPTRIFVSGCVLFSGSCSFAKGVQLLVWDKGNLSIGPNAWFGSFTKIVAFESIIIGSNFMGSWECQLFDTDFHFIKDLNNGRISRNTSPVCIGDNVWLGSRVTILKDTVLSSNTIVAASSVCNSDYSSLGENVLLGGVPAKLLREKVEYIMDKRLERKLFELFMNSDLFDVPSEN